MQISSLIWAPIRIQFTSQFCHQSLKIALHISLGAYVVAAQTDSERLLRISFKLQPSLLLLQMAFLKNTINKGIRTV